ncbi:unnamed protein product [Rotaria sp. Silwood1]|nr:unnamed protein product [Rotaria sp. Silwood1]
MKDVQRYLLGLSGRTLTTSTTSTDGALPNSNKIGLGYNPIFGSPVCYSGACQSEGFARPILKLNYSKRPMGSCTNLLIPEHVDIDCLPSTAITSSTEVIDSLAKLYQTTASGIDVSASISGSFSAFSYAHSSQTRSMIDTMVRQNSTILFTSAQISHLKLSSFSPMMDLSDSFRYVIQRLPCCTYSSKIERYIISYVFNYFGYTYIKDLLLGGIAKQLITISEEEKSNLEKNGVSTSNSILASYGGLFFSASMNMKYNTESSSEKTDIFKKYSKQSSLSTLGGDTSIQSMEEWSKTIASNPAVIKLGISPIFDLLNEDKFPDDPNISRKAEMIQTTLQKYMNNPTFCYNNCTNGTCKPSGYFQFGICVCEPGYYGVDCAQVPMPKSPTASGTLCGFSLSNRFEIVCDGQQSCSSDYQYQTDFYTSTGNGNQLSMGSCFRKEESLQFSPIGTLCGFATTATRNPLNILCNGQHPFHHACPKGYKRGMIGSWATCIKTIEKQDDLPGTLCGMHARREYNYQLPSFGHYRCNNYNIQEGHCPPGYWFASGMSAFFYVSSIADLHVVSFCVKS